MEDEDIVKRFLNLEQSEEALGIAEGKSRGSEAIDQVRSGLIDAEKLSELIRAEALNSFSGYEFRGFAAALYDAIARTAAS
jgi:hypothetical protein